MIKKELVEIWVVAITILFLLFYYDPGTVYILNKEPPYWRWYWFAGGATLISVAILAMYKFEMLDRHKEEIEK